MAKRSTNLSLDVEAIRKGKLYSERHGTNVSQLVSNFLASLPVDAEGAVELSPAVRRLLGIGSGKIDGDSYHRHLLKKYGR